VKEKISDAHVQCVFCLNKDSNTIKLLEDNVPFYVKKYNRTMQYNVYICQLCGNLNYLNLLTVKGMKTA